MLQRTLFVLAWMTATTPVVAEWPQWRGPTGNAVAPAGDYPVKFSPQQNCLWQVDLGGEGASTPIVTGGNIYVTLTEDGQDVVASYRLDGQPRWRKQLGPARPGKNAAATGSNSSPVTDGKHVVCYFKSGLVVCFATSGQEKWRLNLQDKYGKDTLWWDLGTSPLLTSAGVCIAVIQEGNSYLVTLDIETGNEVWKTRRQYQRPKESDQAYTTPSLVQVDGQETIVTFGADYLTGHDAKTGRQLWERDGYNPHDEAMWRVIASQTVANDVAIMPFGRANYLACDPLNAQGKRHWLKQGIGTDVPSPVVAQQQVYVLGDKGEITCLDLASGDIVWQDRLPRSSQKFYSSPLFADGRLYCLRADGVLFVVAADKFELLAENDLGDDSVATPVPVDNTLLVRSRGKLFRFGK